MIKKMINKLKIEKYIFLIFTIGIIISTIVFTYIDIKVTKQKSENPEDIANIINAKQGENIYERCVKIENIQYITNWIGKVTGDSTNYKIYLIMDKNRNWYIIECKNEELEGDLAKLKRQLEKGEEILDNYSIVGTTKKLVDKELKDAVANALNWAYGMNSLNSNNITNYVQNCIVDTKDVGVPNTEAIIIFGSMLLIFSGCTYLSKSSKYKKLKRISDNELEKIDAELLNPNTKTYKKFKIYLTENYMINIKKSAILRYSEIEKIINVVVDFTWHRLEIIEKNTNLRLEIAEESIFTKKEYPELLEILAEKVRNAQAN